MIYWIQLFGIVRHWVFRRTLRGTALKCLVLLCRESKSDWGTRGPTVGVQLQVVCPWRDLNWMRGNLISWCFGNSGLKDPYYTTNMDITILIWSHPTHSGPAFTRCECITWFMLVSSLSLIESCTLGMRRFEAKQLCLVSHLLPALLTLCTVEGSLVGNSSSSATYRAAMFRIKLQVFNASVVKSIVLLCQWGCSTVAVPFVSWAN